MKIIRKQFGIIRIFIWKCELLSILIFIFNSYGLKKCHATLKIKNIDFKFEKLKIKMKTFTDIKIKIYLFYNNNKTFYH